MSTKDLDTWSVLKNTGKGVTWLGEFDTGLLSQERSGPKAGLEGARARVGNGMRDVQRTG